MTDYRRRADGKPYKQTVIWTTREGELIRVCDLTDIHLINCIRLLVRNAKRYYVEYVRNMFRGPVLNGDIAGFICEQGFDDFAENWSWEDFVSDIFYTMELEVERRGVDFDPYEEQDDG